MSTLRIGSRGSQLALAQANRVKNALQQQCGVASEIIPIKTQGDLDQTSPLHTIGGKGVFVKNIEIALLNHEIDFAVHSLKDVTSKPSDGLILAGFLQAEAITDALILADPYPSLNELPPGSVIATGSLRRKALLKKIRPDLKTIDIRGNVPTRVEKMKHAGYAGLMLSEAGLIRLGLEPCITQRFTPIQFCPAPGQGVITVQTRIEDETLQTLCRQISHPDQILKSTTELTLLEQLDFDCHAPFGACATLNGQNMSLQLFVANKNMDRFFEEFYTFSTDDRTKKAIKAAEKALTWLSQYE